MKFIKNTIIALTLMLGAIFTVVPAFTPALAAPVNPQEQACKGTGGNWVPATTTTPAKCSGNTTTTDLPTTLTTIINVILFILGAVAVLMLIIGGITYTISAGDEKAIKRAKDTILYAVIGLVVAFMAYAIVNFVISRL